MERPQDGHASLQSHHEDGADGDEGASGEHGADQHARLPGVEKTPLTVQNGQGGGDSLVPNGRRTGHHQGDLGVDREGDHEDAHHHVCNGQGHCRKRQRRTGAQNVKAVSLRPHFCRLELLAKVALRKDYLFLA